MKCKLRLKFRKERSFAGVSSSCTDLHEDGFLEGKPRQVRDFGRLRGGKQTSLSCFGKKIQNGVHFLFESDFEDSVGLVDHEREEVLVDEALRQRRCTYS